MTATQPLERALDRLDRPRAELPSLLTASRAICAAQAVSQAARAYPGVKFGS